ncbi:E3 ubiquitin-protein ligase HUWE1-like isoform X3 [Oppia nitens]|uniref:E3 ubiquitin-protein ligase HUWE1-like isoform X3 n=1 Tax=Oppia nitens TaxID=1686743 RepID=UPI0023DA47D0|nr:E3 ubiquitin-protein ligase HUWE1-like isoform X3 [Oppia nitens]
MKIDRSKSKKSSSEVPADCKALIDRLKACTETELLVELKNIKSWNCGKCELYHWIDVLDIFDSILESCCFRQNESQWSLPVDEANNETKKELLMNIIMFTALLIEHSFSRHLYNSMEHLITLLSSRDMQIVLAVLNLLYVFSKRSNFISRISTEKRQALLIRLTYLAENWGGKENGFGLAECCQNLPMSAFPSSATTLHFEYFSDSDPTNTKKNTSSLNVIHIDSIDQLDKTLAQIMEEMDDSYKIPVDKQMLLFTHLRLAKSFSNYKQRLQCVQARLQALSIIVYCQAMSLQDNAASLLYNGLIEELVDVLELKDNNLIEIKAASLRTLTSIIHLDRNSKLNTIIDVTGAASYHGFLPALVRSCIQALIDGNTDLFPLPFATALFSFLYHLASYENGGEALVQCGMMESLLKVINWKGTESEHITFVTRAVRVIDLITNLDMTAFQSHSGLNAFVQRLEYEVDICRIEQPFVIEVAATRRESTEALLNESLMSTNCGDIPMEVDSTGAGGGSSSSHNVDDISGNPSTSGTTSIVIDQPIKDIQCYPQRAALLKSMLNFLKKAIQDPAFADTIRHLMYGNLPRSLRHIISNAEYYGPSLFLLATDVVTVYVFQEPSLLSSLQENGLTDVVLHALLVKEVPATREVLASLPNVFSALCLNSRGLEAFVACKPFERLFKVLLSADYLPAMRRRRSSDPMGDTASNLGNAMDELMRHQPSLRTDATSAIIKLLEELCLLGTDPNYVCSKPTAKSNDTNGSGVGGANNNDVVRNNNTPVGNEVGSSDEEEEEDDDATNAATALTLKTNGNGGTSSDAKTPVPLVDYILNVMRFVDAILSNNSTDDHCREFVKQNGLTPLLNILQLPNLPIDFSMSPACLSVASVCKSILNLAHERQVLTLGLNALNQVLEKLDLLHRPLDPPGGSVLLEELVLASGNINSDPFQTSSLTPLLHAMSAAHAYILMFVHVCRTGQSDIRNLSITHWGSKLGLTVLQGLSRLYTSLVWESTVLLALCSESSANANWQFGRHQLERLTSALNLNDTDVIVAVEISDTDANGGAGAALSSATTSTATNMEVDDTNDMTPTTASSAAAAEAIKKNKTKSPNSSSSTQSSKMTAQQKQIKPLLTSASRLGRALAELFGLLVKLCVGSPIRHRRSHHNVQNQPSVPSVSARNVAKSLTKLLASGLSWQPPSTSPIPKFRLTFYICSVGFTSPMLFDDRKHPYHLMLQKFVMCGGQDAFFNTFKWAITQDGLVPPVQGLEHPDLPEGAGEFLDSWLMLLEKMVNPRMVLESPHTMPATKTPQSGDFEPFNAVQYLIRTHRRAFECICHLWDKKPLKVHGERMSESILAILCHILKGEAIIQEKLAKEKETTTTSSSTTTPTVTTTTTSSANNATTTSSTNTTTTTSANAAAAAAAAAAANPVAAAAAAPNLAPVGTGAPNRPTGRINEIDDQGINSENLQQLVDMGFARELAIDALMQTNSLEQATDYLLSHPGPLRSTPGLPTDWDMSEEDQMMRAIAMSLGENITVNDEEGDTATTSGDQSVEIKLVNEEPINKELLDSFTGDILSGCLRLLDTLPDTVYRICDLLLAVAQRNGDKWCSQMISHLLSEISLNVTKLIESTGYMRDADKRSVTEWASQVAQIPEASKAAARIHLFTLLFEELRHQCAFNFSKANIIDDMVILLEKAHHLMSLVANNNKNNVITPKWLAPLILLIDLYDKAAIASSRRTPLLKATKRLWKWFDDRTGRWSAYVAANNKAIDEAYKNGEQVIRFSAGRRRYTVQLSTMVQINEETGNWRPIMFVVDESAKQSNDDNNSSDLTKSGGQQSDTEKLTPVIESRHCQSLITTLVGFINIPVEADTLHAVMRLCLRLTRNNETAALFAEQGGVRAVLQLTQASAFTGFTSLATLIIRHVLEDPYTLRQTMEKVIRMQTHHSPLACREMHYIMRVLGPAACRDDKLFIEMAKSVLRINLIPLTKREEEDPRALNSNSTQFLKVLPGKLSVNEQMNTSTSSSVTNTSNISREVICDLLNALTVKSANNSADNETAVVNTQINSAVSTTVSQIINRDASADMIQADDTDEISNDNDVASSTTTTPPAEQQLKTATVLNVLTADEEANNKKSRILLTQSLILRLLAELTRSYNIVAKAICDHIYTSGQSELITEECTALSFILDHLLPPTQTIGDRDCSALSRVLFAALASATHTPEVQQSLVNEVKSALHRTLILNESNEKHAKIQALTSLISTMIESCPAPTTASSSSSQQNIQNSLRSQTSLMNGIVKNLLRRGLVTDLARVTHSLDLSSPNMAQTVNATLKPLETLSRIVNIPPQIALKSGGKSMFKSEQNNTNAEAMEEDVVVATNLNNSQTATFSTQTLSSEVNHQPNNNETTGVLLPNGNSFADNQNESNNVGDDIGGNFVATEVAEVDDTVEQEQEAYVLDSLCEFNDSVHPRSGTFTSDGIRTDDDEEDQHNDDIEHEDNAEHHSEHHDNVINSNGAESESGDDSQSDDDDDDEDGSAADEERDDDDDDDDDEDDEHIDDDDDDEDPEEDDEVSAYVEPDDIGEHVFRYHDRDDGLVFDLEEMFPASVLHVGDRLSTLLPIIGDEQTNGTDATQPTVPPAPGNVSISHPLLVRHGDNAGASVLSHSANTNAGTAGILTNRSHRANRQRIYRPSLGTSAANHHSWHLPTTRHPNPPAILQRLLGPNTAQDILQLTSSSGLGAGSTSAQVILTSNDLHILATDDELFELQNPNSFVSGNSSSTLGSVPSAMLRWTEESRVLDGDSLHDCVSLIKKEIIDCLEKHRDDELNDRREKKKKEDEEKRLAEEKSKSNESVKPDSEQVNMSTEKLAASLVEQVLGPAYQSSSAAAANNRTAGLADDDVAEVSPAVSMEVTETASTNGDFSSIQNDNEVTEMVCTETQVIPDMPEMNAFDQRIQMVINDRIEMDINNDNDVDDDDDDVDDGVDDDDDDETNQSSLSEQQHQQPIMPSLNPLLQPIDTQQQHTNTTNPPDRPPPPVHYEQDSDVGNAITPEDLSTMTNTSSEGLNNNMVAIGDESQTHTTSTTSIESIVPSLTPTIIAPTQPPPQQIQTIGEALLAQQLQQPVDDLLSATINAPNNINTEPDIPEGVDPSFLAALPENIRQEVIAEHLRLQRLQQQRTTAANITTTQASSSAQSSNTFTEVNPEFLAALPPNIQEEVLAQQRAEQQRIAQQTANPDTPVDAGSFIGTLPPSLRRQVLADMDDSQLALLPPDVATEAQALRQELEARHRQMQERFFSSHAGTALSRILRTAATGRMGGTRYTIHTVPPGQWPWNIGRSGAGGSNLNASSSVNAHRPTFTSSRFKGRQLLDNEALSCLLILLFVEEPKLNTIRLHRVLRNLCYHIPTRQWVIHSLLAIMEKTKELKELTSESTRPRKGSNASSSTQNHKSAIHSNSSWLSISLDAALGCRTNVFQVQRTGGSSSASSSSSSSAKKSGSSCGPSVSTITIHPQAAPLVCRHVLDTLIALAKSFPNHFLPDAHQMSAGVVTAKTDDSSAASAAAVPTTPSSSSSSSSKGVTDFWDVLVKLDSSSNSRKGKSVLKSQSMSGLNTSQTTDPDASQCNVEPSPMSNIICLLSHSVIKRSSMLTDRLLRLLALISLALPANETTLRQSQPLIPSTSTSTAAASAPVVVTTANTEMTVDSRVAANAAADTNELSNDTNSDNVLNDKKSNISIGDTSSSTSSLETKIEKIIASEEQLKLAVDVLTSKSCSEEGLEDATALLLRLSRSCGTTRGAVLRLLLRGAQELGSVVCQHIDSLVQELKALNANISESIANDPDSQSPEKMGKGLFQDRFTNTLVVITAPSNVKHNITAREVQLPSMSALTSKASSQSFFLRILKVIIQLRETIRHQKTKKTTPPTTTTTDNNIAMEVDGQDDSLSGELHLEDLWAALSACLLELADTPDHHAVLVLQPAVEAFFLVHATEKDPTKRRDNKHETRDQQLAHINREVAPLSPAAPGDSLTGDPNSTVTNLPPDTQKFLTFAETHRVVLNQILRQSSTPLAEGPFAVLVDHTRVLDFDVKRRYFRQELERTDDGARREDLAVHVRREHVFEDSFRELHRRGAEEWKNRFYIVFEGEEGQDAGGLLREWYTIISREIFNPMYALFTTSPGDRVTYMINSASHCNSNHLSYFKFVGRVIAKAIYDNKLLECYFTRSFYKHILGKLVKYTDMESEDYAFYQGLVFLLEHEVQDLGYELTYSIEIQEFGVTEVRDLKPNGRNIPVTEEVKHEYVHLVCQEKMTGSIKKQLNAFLEGFYEIIPKRFISIFNEQELELLISGLPNVDIDDLKANSEYHKYQQNSLQIQWFWRALRSFDQADRAKFLQFVTGTSKVPLQGFGALEGMNGSQKFQIHRDDRSTDRLPSAHTCFNQLDLPAYETYDKLRLMLLKAIQECSEGFGFA